MSNQAGGHSSRVTSAGTEQCNVYEPTESCGMKGSAENRYYMKFYVF